MVYGVVYGTLVMYGMDWLTDCEAGGCPRQIFYVMEMWIPISINQ